MRWTLTARRSAVHEPARGNAAVRAGDCEAPRSCRLQPPSRGTRHDGQASGSPSDGRAGGRRKGTPHIRSVCRDYRRRRKVHVRPSTFGTRVARRPAAFEPVRRGAAASSSSHEQSFTRGRPSGSPRARSSGVDRLPAAVRHDLVAAVLPARAETGRVRRRVADERPARASSRSSSAVSVASFLFVPITPLGPRLIQPVQYTP